MKRADPDKIDLERFLPYRLSVLTNLVSGAIADAYRRRFGLSIPEWRVIAVLSRHPGLSAGEVAGLTRMDAVAVSLAVARLLRAGRLRFRVARGSPALCAITFPTGWLTLRRKISRSYANSAVRFFSVGA